MTLLLGRFLPALCAWEVCVLGTFAVVVEQPGYHSWSTHDLHWITGIGAVGLPVTVLVAFVSTRLRVIGTVVSGLFLGLVPSIVIGLWAWLARPGFEESAGDMGLALILAIPSAVGGALAGLIYSWRKQVSEGS